MWFLLYDTPVGRNVMKRLCVSNPVIQPRYSTTEACSCERIAAVYQSGVTRLDGWAPARQHQVHTRQYKKREEGADKHAGHQYDADADADADACFGARPCNEHQP